MQKHGAIYCEEWYVMQQVTNKEYVTCVDKLFPELCNIRYVAGKQWIFNIINRYCKYYNTNLGGIVVNK